MDDIQAEFPQELDVEPLPFHISQPQATEALLTDQDIESFSTDLYQPVYTFLRRAGEVQRNITDTEGEQRKTSSTLSQEPLATDWDSGLVDVDLGTLLLCGDLGPISVDEINIEPLSIGTDIETLSNGTHQVQNALARDAKYQTNMSKQLAHLQAPIIFPNSTSKETKNVDEKENRGIACPTFNDPACVQSVGSNWSNSSRGSVHKHSFLNQTSKKLFQCDMCLKQFRSFNDYKVHRRIHSGEKPYQCDICPKQFATSSSYQRHRRTHTGEKPFLCGICSKRFRTSSDCQRHRGIHTGEKPFKCDVCSKEFLTPSNYQRHRRTHITKKSFQCDICQNRFSTSYNYQVHRRTHIDPVLIQCDLCPKQFRTTTNYRTHRRTHTGEKPFRCDICQKEFSDQNSYRRHRRIDEKPYICNWCNRNYCVKRDLIIHVRKCLLRNVS